MFFGIVLSVTYVGRDHVFAEANQDLFTKITFQMIYGIEY